MKKVLIIGPYFYGYNESIARGFQKNGMETEIINTGTTYPQGLKRRIFVDILPNHFNVSRHLDLYNDRLNELILERYDDFKPDIIFCVKGNKVYGSTLERMSNSLKILWLMDSLYTKELGTKKDRVENVHEKLSYYDSRFFFEKTDLERLSLGTHTHSNNYFLPLALDETVYFPENKNKSIDLLFVGNLSDERVRVMEAVISTFPHKKIEIYGGFHGGLGSFRRRFAYYFSNRKKYFKNITLPPPLVNSHYARSKICLNLHKKQSVYGCNQRFFEIMGAKAFQLVNSNRYIRENFKKNEDFVSFSNDNELMTKIDYYLRHDVERERIAENGYQRVVNNFKFSDRIRFVLNKVGL